DCSCQVLSSAHRRTAPSSPPEASSALSGPNATVFTAPECPANSATISPVVTSQTSSKPLVPPAATSVPSALNATLYSQSLPSRDWSSSRDSPSHRRTHASS